METQPRTGTRAGCSFGVVTLLVGDSGVGKTSLTTRISRNAPWLSTHRPTLGVDYTAYILYTGHDIVRFSIWDTAGEERFAPLVRSYYKDVALVCLVCADTASAKSLLTRWWPEVVRNTQNIHHLLTLLVINKADRRPHIPDTVLTALDAAIVRDTGRAPFRVTVSALNDPHVEKKLFDPLVEAAIALPNVARRAITFSKAPPHTSSCCAII